MASEQEIVFEGRPYAVSLAVRRVMYLDTDSTQTCMTTGCAEEEEDGVDDHDDDGDGDDSAEHFTTLACEKKRHVGLVRLRDGAKKILSFLGLSLPGENKSFFCLFFPFWCRHPTQSICRATLPMEASNVRLVVVNVCNARWGARTVAVAWCPGAEDGTYQFGASVFNGNEEKKVGGPSAGPGSPAPDSPVTVADVIGAVLRAVKEKKSQHVVRALVALAETTVTGESPSGGGAGTGGPVGPSSVVGSVATMRSAFGHATREQIHAIKKTAIERLAVRPCTLVFPKAAEAFVDMNAPHVARAVFEWVFTNSLPTVGMLRFSKPFFRAEDVFKAVSARHLKGVAPAGAGEGSGSPLSGSLKAFRRREAKDTQARVFAAMKTIRPRIFCCRDSSRAGAAHSSSPVPAAVHA